MMITLKNISLNNKKNKTYLKFDGPICFENNTINFIIGSSGVGKTSLIDFMTSPFTDDPVKNGDIIFSPEIAPRKKRKKPVENFSVKNSAALSMGLYAQFIRDSIAYIPQKTDSFHPLIPVRKQMYQYYKAVLPETEEPDENKFNQLIEELSPYAGWDKITVDPDNPNALILFDKKEYADDRGGKPVTIVDTQKNSETGKYNSKVYENEFSSGQRQRIFILLGLIQASLAENPILLGDEFLVNFTYREAAVVLEKIKDFFFNKIRKKYKTAVLILHDLSFDFLQKLPPESGINVFALEQDTSYEREPKREADDIHRITIHETGIYDFFHKEPEPKDAIFGVFLESYKRNTALKLKNDLCLKNKDGVIMSAVAGPSKYPVEGLYGKIEFTLKRGRFYILTGFSGVGKTTFCNELLSKCVNKKSFRYLTSHMLSAISTDSQITIRQDLSHIYRYYNDLTGLDECREKIEKLFHDVHLNGDLNKYLDQKIFDLSGGELQRYWFARLLLDHNLKEGDAEFLVLDESIASLDCITKNIIITMLIENVLAGRGMTVFLVSHDLRDIGVINKTLESIPGAESVFEHYEMFGGDIHKVITPFHLYCDNLLTGNYNTYQFSDGERNFKLIEKDKQEN